MKKKLLYVFLIFITVLLIINPQDSIKYARNGLNMCSEIIVPSLFPFFICSGLLIYSGFCEILAKLMQPVMKPLFNVNGSGAAAFVLGIISGYPLGAVTACQLYEKMYLSKSEAERMLAFCNNSGPLFILGAVGVSLYQNPKIGAILYTSHILSAVLVGILFRFYKADNFCAPAAAVGTEDKSIGEIFSNVLANSIQSILTVCGAVVFFSMVSNVLFDLFPIDDTLKIYTVGFLEFVTGVNMIAYSQMPLFSKIILSAAIVGFAGASVHVQVLGVVSKYGLSLKPYILGKCMQGGIAALLTMLILKIYPVEKNVFAPLSIETGGAFAMNSLFVIITVMSVFFIALSGIIYAVMKKSFELRRTAAR